LNLLDRDKTNTRYDVMTDDQKSFQNSERNNFLIYKSGTAALQLAATANNVVLNIPHSLGYVPAHLIYFTTDFIQFTNTFGLGSYISARYTDSAEGSALTEFGYNIDTNNISFSISYSNIFGTPYGTIINAAFKYYIYRETAT